MAKIYHPDKNPDSPFFFKQTVTSPSFKDEKTRKKYDSCLRPAATAQIWLSRYEAAATP